ncbi:hypothetical protein Hanom_Chr08g00740771 [Helianthus anomalus]
MKATLGGDDGGDGGGLCRRRRRRRCGFVAEETAEVCWRRRWRRSSPAACDL